MNFLNFFWSKTLKYYCTSDFYQFLELQNPKKNYFSQKREKTKISSIFHFFLDFGCKSSKMSSITSLNRSDGFNYFIFWPKNIKNRKMKVYQKSDKLAWLGILMKEGTTHMNHIKIVVSYNKLRVPLSSTDLLWFLGSLRNV